MPALPSSVGTTPLVVSTLPMPLNSAKTSVSTPTTWVFPQRLPFTKLPNPLTTVSTRSPFSMKASRSFSARPPMPNSSLSIWDSTALLNRRCQTSLPHSPVRVNVDQEKDLKARYPPPHRSLRRDGSRATNIKSFWRRSPSLRTSTPFTGKSIESSWNRGGLNSPSIFDPSLLIHFHMAVKSSCVFEEVSTVFERIPV